MLNNCTPVCYNNIAIIFERSKVISDCSPSFTDTFSEFLMFLKKGSCYRLCKAL